MEHKNNEKNHNNDLNNITCNFTINELSLINQALMTLYVENADFLKFKKDDFSQRTIPKLMNDTIELYQKVSKLY